METQQAEESRPDGQLQDDGAAEASTSGTAEQQAPMPFETALTARFRGKFKPLEPPTYEQMMSEDVMNNCFIKSVLAGAMGGALGVAFGLFTASLDTGGIDNAPIDNNQPTRVVIRQTLQNMKQKSVSYAKGFAFMGFLYSGCECLVEKSRAKHDKWNATYAGCATGAIMAVQGGPKAMCFGCATFAAFSTAIEYFTGGH